jgi:catechol 2,3-dioxygenase-like lactoylglutathione lyase family enzyme
LRGAIVFGKKRLFLLGDGIAVDVVNLEAARRWYAEKLGLDYSSTDLPEEEGSMVLGYSAKERLVYLNQVVGNRHPNARPGHPPMLFASKVEAAHEYLSSRAVAVGPLQSDSGGNRFFRFSDLEGNEVEVCQEH